MNEDQFKGRRAFFIVLSILAAFAVWLFAELYGTSGIPRTVEYEFTNIPIEYLDEDEDLSRHGLMMVTDETDATVDLMVEGTRWMVANVDRSKIRVVVDLSGITNVGVQNVPYRVLYSDRKIWDSISVKESNGYNTVRVHIAELYSKVVDVHYEVQGNVDPACYAEQPQLSHSKIEIRGLAKDIDPVDYVKVTLDIGKDLDETLSESLDYLFYDANDYELDGSKIHKTVDKITITLPVLITKELPLVVNFIDAPGARIRNTKHEIIPKSITVSGDAAKLKDVNNIVLGEFDLLELGNGTTKCFYQISIPEGCQNLTGMSRATLVISFKDMATSSVITQNFDYRNLPEDKTITVLTEEVSVSIFGTSADVSDVTGDVLTVVADLSDFTGALGTYSVPATVVSQTSGDIGILGTYRLQVNIQNAEEEPEAPIGEGML